MRGFCVDLDQPILQEIDTKKLTARNVEPITTFRFVFVVPLGWCMRVTMTNTRTIDALICRLPPVRAVCRGARIYCDQVDLRGHKHERVRQSQRES